MFINPSLAFQYFLYFILSHAINTEKMLPNCLLVVCSCCLYSLVASRLFVVFRVLHRPSTSTGGLGVTGGGHGGGLVASVSRGRVGHQTKLGSHGFKGLCFF